MIESHRKGETLDEHWRAVYEFCTPCSLNYTLIAKVETFRRDTEYIIRQAGLETLLFNKMPPTRVSKRLSNRALRNTSSVVKRFVVPVIGMKNEVRKDSIFLHLRFAGITPN